MIYFVVAIVFGILGAIIPFVLHNHGRFNPVQASVWPSLIIALAFYFSADFIPEIYQHGIPAIFFGASFAGMATTVILPRIWHVSIAGIIFSIFYLNTSVYFDGFGGALGTTACIAVVMVFGVRHLLMKKV